MKLQFKRQKFQADAANAVCDIFKGQRLYDAAYLIDRDVSSAKQNELSYDEANIGIRNHTIEVSDTDILTNLRSIQKQQMLRPDDNEEVADYAAAIYDIVDSIYNPKALLPEDGRKNNVEVSINNEQFARKEFKELWRRINAKSVYTVCFDTAELIQKSIDAINNELSVSQIYFTVTQGTLISINSREVLEISGAFEQAKTGRTKTSVIQADNSVKFDLVGKIVEETGLTRRTVVSIFKGISKEKFAMFSQNPEEFIIKVSRIINEQKATAIVQYIEYTLLAEKYDSVIFTEPALKGRIGTNAVPLQKHLYDYLIYDSETESRFAVNLDKDSAVTVFVKLPKSFYINTPVGNYSPDWAIAFKEGSVKRIYFVAETKGSMSSLELRKIEEAKINCARKHFAKIGAELVMYDKIDSYETLLNKVMR